LIYKLTHIASVISASLQLDHEEDIQHLLTDSRRIYAPSHSLFFALRGERRNGHQFIGEVYQAGVRNFVVSEPVDTEDHPGANFLFVNDTLAALQDLAAYHRSQFNIPLIGVTGSNGKTIVKEWLYQLLHEDLSIVRSPRSYNSQLGVPLSVWLMNEQHQLAIFEAGISKKGEMEKLERIIQPTIAVLTSLGEAHSEGFSSMEEKAMEKRILFRHAEEPALLSVQSIEREEQFTTITALDPKGTSERLSIRIPFTDEASVDNAILCWRILIMLGFEQERIAERMSKLVAVNMRLELKKGINNCTIINDSYSADKDSLEIALNFQSQQTGAEKKTVILSDLLQSAASDGSLYHSVLESLEKHGVSRLIAIGPRISHWMRYLITENTKLETFSSTEAFLEEFLSSHFREENILVKGARIFGFERIVQVLELKAHQTVLEIDLSSIAHNLKVYQSRLQPSTRIMAMVKAFAYGSGGAEISAILQYHKADYLGVAYADEGVELRKAGIRLPIMVMNTEESAFEKIVAHNLEPELYSFELLEAFDQYLQEEGLQQYPVHIELETGMNRLGFAIGDLDKLISLLKKTLSFRVQSVFTHFAASEELVQDEFTREQFKLFSQAAVRLESQLGYTFLKHAANSAAAIRFPEMQMDMVRLGIGLYGVDSADSKELDLHTVATLRTTISQLKKLKAGESVSYNRRSVLDKDALIATVRIGYADGFPRRLGNGLGKVMLGGKLAPVIGTVCMDMFMIDVTEIKNVKEGDDVIIFGKDLPVGQLAQWAGTIPYEIMTAISQRVRRVYFEE